MVVTPRWQPHLAWANTRFEVPAQEWLETPGTDRLPGSSTRPESGRF